MSVPVTTPTLTTRPDRDLGFVVILLALVAVPLLALRSDPIIYNPLFKIPFALMFAVIVAAWVRASRRDSSIDTCEPRTPISWHKTAGFVLGLGAVLVAVYYLPLREHFWGGWDEIGCLRAESQTIWSSSWDKYCRPMWGLAPLLGSLLTPDRVDGFLWATCGICVLNGLLLTGIVRRLLPGEPAIAAAAGILLLCHRGDLSRFFVLWTAIWYWTSLALLLLGTFLYLESARSGNRGGLVASCMAVGAGLLGNEAGFPLAAFGPILLYLSGVRGSRLLVWSLAWIGTAGILAARFIQYFLAKKETYQADTASFVIKDPERLLDNLSIQTEPFLGWFNGFSTLGKYWLAASVAAAIAATVVVLAGRGRSQGARQYAIGAVVSCAIALAGLAPFLPFSYPFRTQFYTAPGQAALIAIILGGLTRIAGTQVGLVSLAFWVAVLTGVSAAGNREFQNTTDKHVNYVKSVHILKQIHAAAPKATPDILIVLLPEDGVRAAADLGSGYSFVRWAHEQFGFVVVQEEPVFANGLQVNFLPDRVDLKNFILNLAGQSYPYEKLVLFRITSGGTLTLLQRIPADLHLNPEAIARYNPVRLLRAGPLHEVPFIRYPTWLEPPQDVVDVEDGFIFAEGWSGLQTQDGRIYRQIEAQGDLIVNSLGQASRILQLDVEPVQMPEFGCSIEVRDAKGKVLDRSPLHGHERVKLTIPTNPLQATAISLRAVPDGQPVSAHSSIPLRVYAPPGAKPAPDSPIRRDIVRGYLELGQNWFPPDNSSGECVRGFHKSAELKVLKPDGGELMIDAIGAPALVGMNCQLRVLGPDNRILHEAKLNDADRRAIRCSLPADLTMGTILRLEVVGEAIANTDPRSPNILVFRCELRR